MLEGAGGGIAWVDKGGFSGFVTLFIEFGECLIGHEDLATNFKQSRRTSGQTQRDRFDGADILADVIAGGAIAAGYRIIEHTITVNCRDRHAINLGFDGERDMIHTEVFGQALIPVSQVLHLAGIRVLQCLELLVLELMNVLDGKHRHEVLNLLKIL